MACKAAVKTDEWHGWECGVTGGACMYLSPNSKRCAEEYGEGPDANTAWDDGVEVDPAQIMFLDGVCSKCGGNAGNGGVIGEPLRCGKCGWVQPPEECESMYKEMATLMEGLKSDN